MERKRLDRALGPYAYPDHYMIVMVPAEITGNKGKKTKTYPFKTPSQKAAALGQAQADVAAFNEQAQLTAGTTVGEALVGYPAYLAKPKGRKPGNAPRSIQTNIANVRNILTDDGMVLGDIDAPYLAERELDRRALGRSDDTVINEVKAASRFLAYCTERKLIRANPLAGYTPDGIRNHGGKGHKQPNLDDLPAWLGKAYELAETEADAGAIAAIACLKTGLRATKVLTRRARHVDLQGAILRMPPEDGRARPKNKRTPDIMPVSDPRLAALLVSLKAQCAQGDDYLWPSRARGRFPSKTGHRNRNWLAAQIQRICRAAGVPDDTHAHGMRGVMGTVAMIDGATLDAIQRNYGHRIGSAVTERSYLLPEAVHLSNQNKLGKVTGN